MESSAGSIEKIDQGLLQEAVNQVLDDILPITGIYSEQASLSIAALALKRVCHEEAIEQCEDPLLDAKYLELCLNSWKQLTPKRLSSVVCQEDVRAEPTLDYHKYSAGSSNHPGKREAASPPPEAIDREEQAGARFKSQRMRRRMQRAEKGKRRRYTALNSDIYQATEWNLENAPRASTGWQGSDINNIERDKLRDKLLTLDPQIMQVLASFTRIPYDSTKQPATRIVDKEGRLFIYRSKRAEWQEQLLPDLAKAIQRFTEHTVVDPIDQAGNKRGPQKFCIAGVDRQSKGRPRASGWHTKGNNSQELDLLFTNSAMLKFNELASTIVSQHFPRIAKRMQDAQAAIARKYNLPPGPFGLFSNFCINSPVFEEGICDVFCTPHTDAKNAAILVCAVLVYYYGECKTNADERIWLCFWEARIIMQVPAGVFVVYPSALLLHFNVRLEDVLLVTQDGSFPTPTNTTPFTDSNAQNGGRGSIVWFTQASMLISAEMPTDTIKQANVLNKLAKANGAPLIDTTYNAADALKDGFFPYDLASTSTD